MLFRVEMMRVGWSRGQCSLLDHSKEKAEYFLFSPWEWLLGGSLFLSLLFFQISLWKLQFWLTAKTICEVVSWFWVWQEQFHRGYEKGQDRSWTWVWVSSGSWWRTGKPCMLQSMGSQRVGHNWATEQRQQRTAKRPTMETPYHAFAFMLE